MPESHLLIDFDENRQPYNTRLIVNLLVIKQIIPILQPELLKGLVDTSGEDNVIMHLNLSAEKVSEVQKFKPLRHKKVA